MNRNTGIGQYIPGDSPMHRLDPRSKVIATLFFITAGLAAPFPQPLLAVVLAGLLQAFLTGINLPYYLKSSRVLFYLVLITALLQVILGVRPEKAGELILRLTLIIMAVQILMTTTSPLALMSALERMLSPFKRLKLPVEELIMIMTIALRFIPLYMEEWERIKKAQMSRGVNFADKHVAKRIKNITALLVPLFRISFERAGELALAMETRCYQGARERTYLYDFKITASDLFYIAVTGGIAFISICL